MSTTVAATARSSFGTSAATAIRAAGQVPVTICRSGAESIHLTIAVKDAESLTQRVGQVVVLEADDQSYEVLIKGYQRHPISDVLQQIDSLAVEPDKLVRVAVPLNPLTLDCPGIKAGGLLESMLRRVEVQCPAKDIPDHLDVDLAQAVIGTTIYADGVILPEGVKMLTPPRVAIMTIIKTRGMRRAEAAAKVQAKGG